MANFNLFIPSIQTAEGGYQKLTKDKGNYNSKGELVGTNHGISAKFYEQIIGYPPSEQDMRNITKATALQLFKHYYWDKIKADDINSQAVAETFADHAINAGVRGATKLMQKTLTKLGEPVQIDGVVGNQTITAINNLPENKLFSTFNAMRISYYQSLSTFWKFGKSWLSRVYAIAKKYPMQTGVSLIMPFGFFLLGLYLFNKKKQQNES